MKLTHVESMSLRYCTCILKFCSFNLILLCTDVATIYSIIFNGNQKYYFQAHTQTFKQINDVFY